MRSLDFLVDSNHSSGNVALGSTQPLTGMSAAYLPGGKGRPVRKDYNLRAICEPTVSQPYGSRRPVTGTAFPYYAY
jgi:hypothetical protein